MRLLLLVLLVLPQAKPDASTDFFKNGVVPRLVLELGEEACQNLRSEPRKWVLGTLRENEKTIYKEVAFKLKGAAGSFRDFDDQPSFTVRVDQDDADQRFHGLRRFHLNRSPQDESLLQELLGSEIFRGAGLLAPRITHARVVINKRDMGLYVLKEGFDSSLLKRGFEKSTGNLYDGGFCQDLDAPLEKDSGRGADDRSDLTALLETCREPDLVQRWAKLPELVELKNFLTYMALELMLGHWDGYCCNRNNYRLYFDPTSKKAHFIPHGMDQLFGDADASILDNPTAILALVVMRNPKWRAEYRKRLVELLPLFNADRLKKRVDEVAKRLNPLIQAWNKDRARGHEGAVEDLKRRLTEREKSLKEQVTQPDPRPLVFTLNTPVKLTKWRSNSACEDAALSSEKENGVELLKIATGKSGRCIASWRRSVLLARGRYRLNAMMRVKGVEALAEDAAVAGAGAGLRLSGGAREKPLVGTTELKKVEFEFEVAEEAADVELVVELRAAKGEMAVAAESLWLTKIDAK